MNRKAREKMVFIWSQTRASKWFFLLNMSTNFAITNSSAFWNIPKKYSILSAPHIEWYYWTATDLLWKTTGFRSFSYRPGGERERYCYHCSQRKPDTGFGWASLLRYIWWSDSELDVWQLIYSIQIELFDHFPRNSRMDWRNIGLITQVRFMSGLKLHFSFAYLWTYTN